MALYRPSAASLTGATGQLGRAWLRTMAVQHPSMALRLLVRPDSAALAEPAFQALLRAFRGGVTVIPGDLASLTLSNAAAEALCRADGGLWHFGACTQLHPASDEVARLARAVNVEGTAALLALCAHHPPTQLFHVSTAYVAGTRGGLIHENDLDLHGPFRNPYEATKAEAEAQVRQAFARGLPGTLFRPSLVIEEHPTESRSLARLVAAAVAARVRGGHGDLTLRMPATAAMNMVGEVAVVETMLQLAARPAAGATYHLTAAAPTRLEELGELLARRLPGFRLRFAPQEDVAALDGPSGLLDRVLGPLCAYFRADVAFDRTHLLRDLGHAPAEIDWPALVARRLEDAGLLAKTAEPPA